MNVPFLDLRRVYLEQKTEIDAAVASTLDSGWYILGKTLTRFEGELRDQLGGKGHVLGCNSGTDALVLALLASGVGPGDEVVTVAHTAIPTITAIRATGATPVFAEIDAETWLLDTTRLPLTPRTKAVIAVHLYGNMVAPPVLPAGVTYIEDVAQAQGARLGGRQAGTLGRFGCYSFYPSKNIGALGDGGAVRAATDEDGERLRMLRNYGQKDRYNALVDRGINSRLDEVQAAVLSVRLKRLEEWNQRKVAQTARYRKELGGLPLKFQKVTQSCDPGWHLCVVALENQSVREGLMGYLEKNGVQTIIHYPIPTHRQAAFRSEVSLPVTESLASRIVSLPLSSSLTEAEQTHVIAMVQGFFKR